MQPYGRESGLHACLFFFSLLLIKEDNSTISEALPESVQESWLYYLLEVTVCTWNALSGSRCSHLKCMRLHEMIPKIFSQC